MFYWISGFPMPLISSGLIYHVPRETFQLGNRAVFHVEHPWKDLKSPDFFHGQTLILPRSHLFDFGWGFVVIIHQMQHAMNDDP